VPAGLMHIAYGRPDHNMNLLARFVHGHACEGIQCSQQINPPTRSAARPAASRPRPSPDTKRRRPLARARRYEKDQVRGASPCNA
jgi:hypothetical protein